MTDDGSNMEEYDVDNNIGMKMQVKLQITMR